MLSPQELIQLSKRLSYVLRHGAVKEKLTLRTDGYLAVSDLLQRPKFKDVTMEQIQQIVETNDKQRFKLLEEGGKWYIRANQGHSLKVDDIALEELQEALPTVVHGTQRTYWPAIREQGLSRMRRNHIHLATGLADNKSVISGMRASSQIFIYIDMPLAMKDGIVFYRSENNVILTGGQNGTLSPKYFARVDDCNGERLL